MTWPNIILGIMFVLGVAFFADLWLDQRRRRKRGDWRYLRPAPPDDGER